MAWTNHPEDAYVDEIQHPGTPPPGTHPGQELPTSQESWTTGLTRSALVGAGSTLPFTAGAAFIPGFGMPAALGLEATGALSGAASYTAGRLFPHTWWAGPAAGLAVGGVGGLGRSAMTALGSEPSMVNSLALSTLGGHAGKILNYLFPETIGPATEEAAGFVGAASPFVYPLARRPSNLLFPSAGGAAGGAVYETTPSSIQLPDVNVNAPAPPIR